MVLDKLFGNEQGARNDPARVSMPTLDATIIKDAICHTVIPCSSPATRDGHAGPLRASESPGHKGYFGVKSLFVEVSFRISASEHRLLSPSDHAATPLSNSL